MRAQPVYVILYDLNDDDIPIMSCSPEHTNQQLDGTDGWNDGGLNADPNVRNIRVLEALFWINEIPSNN